MRKLIIIVLLLFCPHFASADSAQLHLVTSLDPLEADEYIKEFEKISGVDVEWIRLSAGEVVARLKAEEGNATQSVWFGGPVPEFIVAQKAGLLQDSFTQIYFGPIVFITNKNYIAEHGLKPPASWQDLLNEEWKGRITIAYPYTAGTGYTILAGLISLMGEDGALEYWKKLDASIHHYTKSGATPIIEVGLGEASVGVVFAQDAFRKGVSRGFPLVVTYPAEGTAHEIGAVALIKGGPDIKEGKKFIDWIVSLPAQNLFHKYGRTPVHPKAITNSVIPKESVTPKESVIPAHPSTSLRAGAGIQNSKNKLDPRLRGDDIKLIEMDMTKLGENKSKYIKAWRERLGQ